MTDDQHQPRTADEIPEWELEEMIRAVITQAMRADIAERALAWLDRVDDLLAGLRKEMPDGAPEEIAGTEAKMPSLPVMTGDQWNEFVRLLTSEEQRAFMADVRKLINIYCRRIGGD